MTDHVAGLDAAFELAALGDRSELARIVGTGPDLLDLLNRLSTGALASLAEDQGRASVLTTPKGRIVEQLYVHQRGSRGVLLIAGPGSAERVVAHLERFTFAEKTGLTDRSAETCQLVVIGPAAAQALAAVGLPVPEAACSRLATLADVEVDLLGHDGLTATGFSVVAPIAAAESVRQALLAGVEQVGGRSISAAALETYRILRGIPLSGHELTEEHNPLEAGLWDAVSFDKGCYVGQEVVARLRTYDKVSSSLVGLELPAGPLPPPGTALLVDGRAVGSLTSAVEAPGFPGPIGLGYLKRRARDAGASHVELGGDPSPGTARLVELPFR